MKVFCAVLVLLTLSGCDKLKSLMDKDSGASTSSSSTPTTDEDTGVAAAAEDAAAEAAAPAANEADIKRFPTDEEAATDAVTVQWATVDAKTEPSTGKIVTSLPKGAAATLVARRGKTVLATFQDPKDATKTLMGWLPEDAFTPGTTPPPVVVITAGGPPKSTGVCPAGQTLLFDADAFCGKTCKADKDCTAPQVCKGTAKTLGATGLGAAVTICAKPKPDAGAPIASLPKPDAGAAVTPAPDAGTAPRTDAGPAILAPLTTRAGALK